MSKVELVEVNTPLNSSSFQEQINSNFTAISEALDKQLQREAQAGVENEMHQNLDMGSEYRIINLAKPVNPSDAARKQDVDDAEVFALRAEEAAAVAVEKADIATTAARDAAQDADDADAAKRAAISAAQSSVDAKDAAVIAQGKAEAAETAIRTLLTEDYPEITTVADNIEDVKTVAENITDVQNAYQNAVDAKDAAEDAADSARDAAESAQEAKDTAALVPVVGNIGDIRATMRADLPEGAIWCDGAELSLEDFPGLKQAIAQEIIPWAPLSTWTTYLTNNEGQAPIFFVDATVNNHVVTFNSNDFRAPLLKDVFIEANKDTVTPDVIPAGIPNITGTINGITTHELTCDGAFTAGAYAGTNVSGSGATWVEQTAEFDASDSSSIYNEDITTVQPLSIRYKHYVIAREYPRIIFTNKPGVATVNDLPTTGNELGDTRVVRANGYTYVWVKSGSTYVWDLVGSIGSVVETYLPGTGIDITGNLISALPMVGADGVNAGTLGAVPTPSATDNTKFLGGDGAWHSIPDPLPSQAGQDGKFLGTNGTNTFWGSVPKPVYNSNTNTLEF